MEDKKPAIATGTILEALPNAMFRVLLPGGEVVLAYLSGKMRINHIKVLIGDTVGLEVDEYGRRGRIVKRL